jgi:hypothetical protein
MKDISGFRTRLLRTLYEQSLKDPQAALSISDMRGGLGDDMPTELVQLVVDELQTSGLIIVGDADEVDARPLKLTAKGYYEAEQLGGAIKKPFVARAVKFIKDHQVLIGLTIAFLGIVLVVAYPEYKEWQDRRATEEALRPIREMQGFVDDGRRGVRDMEHLSQIDDYCRQNPSASDYGGVSCQVLRGERPPTQEEARDYCQRYTQTFSFGGADCEQFRQ